MIISFLFNYNSRSIQEYFQAKIGRKIRIFSLARRNNILIQKIKRVYLETQQPDTDEARSDVLSRG